MTKAKSSKPPKYLVCVDGRDESRAALKLGCLKARERGGAVALLHVTPPIDFQTMGAVVDKMRQERNAEGDALLKTLAEQAANAYGVVPTLLLREGQTGEEIVAAAEGDPETTMILVGVAHHSSERGTLSAWLATQLGVKLFIPLLMVPGNLTDQQLLGLI